MRIKSLLTATALSLALIACSSEGDKGATKGEPIAKVAAPAGKQWVDVVSKTSEGGYLIGNPDAKLKLVEYLAVTCPHCAEFEHEAYEELLGKYVANGQVNLEIRNFLLNPYDIPITLLTRCSDAEAYLPLTQQFYQNQAAVLAPVFNGDPQRFAGALKEPENQRFVTLAKQMGILDFFKARGISEQQANACLADPAAQKQLIAMTEKASNELKVTGTPYFFLNGNAIELENGTPVWTQIKAKLADAGAR